MNKTVTIPLTQGKVAIIDKEDEARVSKYKWFCATRGYAVRVSYNLGKKATIYLHQFIKSSPNGLVGNHINGDRLDNRKANLRACSRQQASRTQIKIKKKTSKYKGVSWDSTKSKWKADIYINNRTVNLSRYVNEDDAARTYNKAASGWFGEFARLNVIE